MDENGSGAVGRLRSLMDDDRPSVRLQAALTAGTHPDAAFVPVLVERCAVEPDFYVRDMLTWALTRHPVDLVVPRVLAELTSETAQARSQGLHTLSKIGDPRGWPAVTDALLRDADDEVARAAWRTASGLAPESARADLAATLVTQLARGDRDVRLSLSRAFVELGDAAVPALEGAARSRDDAVGIHARATLHLQSHPDDSFEAAVWEARREAALRDAPRIPDPAEGA